MRMPPTRDVQAGLQRHHVAGHEGLVGLADEVRRLGVRQTEAVAGVVREIFGHACLVEHAAHGLIDRRHAAPAGVLSRRQPWPARRDRRAVAVGGGLPPTTSVLVKSLR